MSWQLLASATGYALRDRIGRGPVAVLFRRHTGVHALRERSGRRRRAWIGGKDSLLSIGGCNEELDQIGRADRAVEGEAHSGVLNRRVLNFELVCIGNARRVVIGPAISHVSRKIIN